MQSITTISTASLIYSLLSFSLITFLLNINSTPSPPTFKRAIISLFLGFLFKKNISSYRGKLISILAVRILLFINSKGKLINISNVY